MIIWMNNLSYFTEVEAVEGVSGWGGNLMPGSWTWARTEKGRQPELAVAVSVGRGPWAACGLWRAAEGVAKEEEAD